MLRWADVPPDDAPRKVPEAFRGAVRCGGVAKEGRCEVAPSTCQIHQAMQPIGHTRRNQPTKWSRVESRQAKANANAWDRSPTGSTIHCLPRQAASSKQRQGKPMSTPTSTSTSKSRSRSKRVVARNQSPRGGGGKWINRSEQVGLDDMTGMISMAKRGR